MGDTPSDLTSVARVGCAGCAGVDMGVAVVVGVGPGLGGAVAERFAREGFAVALVARGHDKLEPVRERIVSAGGRALAVTADASDEASVAGLFDTVRADLGDPDVLVYNAGAFTRGAVADLDPKALDQAWRVGCFGAFLCARQVIPAMVKRKSGTILLTGATASLRGSAGFAALAVQKFGQRALSQSLARELGPSGVHVAHVVIDGMIDLPSTRAWFPDRAAETFLSPTAIAEAYWQLHAQDRTAWTQELDLRPATEKF